MHNITLEICCGDSMSLYEAEKGGASRIELCSGLYEGGVTPSVGLINAALESEIKKINVLIRPRPGDFLYSPEEVEIMENDIKNAVKRGAGGIVTGVLTKNGDVDIDAMLQLIDVAKTENENVEITFHRAFDLSRDYRRSLEDIINLGCNTLLTSGMASGALQGSAVIRELVKDAGNDISVMAGGGITPENVIEIVKLTGVKAVHASARKIYESKMEFQRKSLSMGSDSVDEYAWKATDAETVSTLLKLLNT